MAKKAAEYQNNPFFVALDGLKALFNKASSVGIFLIVLSVLSLGGNAIPAPTEPTSRSEELAQRTQFESFFNEMSVSDWVVISLIGGTILFVLILIGLVIGGIADYTASKLASNEGTTLGEAFKEVMKHVASYLWLSVLIFVKVFLWTLLFIIPGIYMAIRYSLAGTVFFKENSILQRRPSWQRSHKAKPCSNQRRVAYYLCFTYFVECNNLWPDGRSVVSGNKRCTIPPVRDTYRCEQA